GVVLVVPIRVVPATAVVDLLRAQSEQEEVLGPRLFGHLNRCAIARADRQRSVHHELHVAGAAGLVTGRRDLVGDVGPRYQALGQGDAVTGSDTDLTPDT